MSQSAKSEARKQNPRHFDSSISSVENDESDTTSTTGPLSDDGTEDEGIESGSTRNYQGASFTEKFKQEYNYYDRSLNTGSQSEETVPALEVIKFSLYIL